MFRWEDMLVILVVGLFLFGPDKMVGFGKSLGAAISEFKKAANPDSQNAQAAAQPAIAAAPAKVKRSRVVAKKTTKVKAARA